MAETLVSRRPAQLAMGTLYWLIGGDFTPSMIALLAAEVDFDLGERLHEITVPTLVVGGDRDRCYPRELIEATAHGIPKARLVLYEGRGHSGVAADRRLPRDVLAFLTGNALPEDT